jgi:hypothetical protein
MAQAVSRRPLTTKTRLKFHVISVVYKVALEEVFLRVLRLSLVIIVPLMLHTHLCLHVVVTKRETPGDLPKRDAVSETGKQGIEKYFHFVFKGLNYIAWQTADYLDACASFLSPVKHFVAGTVICRVQHRISKNVPC